MSLQSGMTHNLNLSCFFFYPSLIAPASDMLHSIIQEQIANFMVLPNRYPIQLAEGLDINKLRYPQPQVGWRLVIFFNSSMGSWCISDFTGNLQDKASNKSFNLPLSALSRWHKSSNRISQIPSPYRILYEPSETKLISRDLPRFIHIRFTGNLGDINVVQNNHLNGLPARKKIKLTQDIFIIQQFVTSAFFFAGWEANYCNCTYS